MRDEPPPQDDERLPSDASDDAWLDEGTLPPLPIEPRDQRRLAHLAFLDAALQHVMAADSRGTAHEQRIARVLEAIDGNERRERDSAIKTDSLHEHDQVAGIASESPRPLTTWVRKTKRWRLAGWTLAASIMGGTWLLLASLAPNAAQTALAAMTAAATEPVDREYALELLQDGAALRELRGTLYVRGNSHFALRAVGPLGGEHWLGGSRDHVWFSPPVGPLLVSDDPRYLQAWMSDALAPVPFLQITRVLERLQADYAISMRPNEPAPGETIPRQRLHANRRTPRPELPVTIEVWSELGSGIIRRLELVWLPAPERQGPARLVFTFVKQAPQPDALYQAEGHQTPGRRVWRR